MQHWFVSTFSLYTTLLATNLYGVPSPFMLVAFVVLPLMQSMRGKKSEGLGGIQKQNIINTFILFQLPERYLGNNWASIYALPGGALLHVMGCHEKIIHIV